MAILEVSHRALKIIAVRDIEIGDESLYHGTLVSATDENGAEVFNLVDGQEVTFSYSAEEEYRKTFCFQMDGSIGHLQIILQMEILLCRCRRRNLRARTSKRILPQATGLLNHYFQYHAFKTI